MFFVKINYAAKNGIFTYSFILLHAALFMRLFDFFRNKSNPDTASGQAVPKATQQSDATKQVFLSFQEGNSDKVYHLTLRAEPNDAYSVHFAYGRRGNALQSGTKTETPVDLATAEKIFAALLQEKTKKGYQPYGGPEVAPRRSYAKKSISARNTAILGHLMLANQNPEKQLEKNWSLSRVVWRAGVLGLPEALPYLAPILQQKDPKNPVLLRYCTLWAIARCARTANETQKSSVRPALHALAESSCDALLWQVCAAVFPAAECATWREQLIEKLPLSFQHQIQRCRGDALLFTLKDYLENRPKSHFAFVENLYALTTDCFFIRPAVLYFAEKAPFQPGTFKVLRHLYKMAEMRLDAELFGVLCRRFSMESANFSILPAGQMLYKLVEGGGGRLLNQREELIKSDSLLAFSNKTRQWFIRRSLQTLLDTQTTGDHTFVKMATGVLLAHDAVQGKTMLRYKTRYTYNKAGKWTSKTTVFPEYSEYPTFFYLLNGANPNYTLLREKTVWGIPEEKYQKLKKEAPDQYYEPHTELWDACPQAYIHLMAESKNQVVQAFALRRLSGHPKKTELIARFDKPLLLRMIHQSYLPTALFALEIAESRFDAQQPDSDLVLMFLDNPHEAIRQKAHQWMQRDLHLFIRDTAFVFRLLTHKSADIRRESRQIMPQITTILNEIQQQNLAGTLVAYMISLEEPEAALAEDIMLGLDDWAEKYLVQVHLDILFQLVQHPIPCIKTFGAFLVWERPHEPQFLPDNLLQLLLDADAETVRERAIAILEQYTPQALIYRRAVLAGNIAHPNPDIRQHIRTHILRALDAAPDFSDQVTGVALNLLLRKEMVAGVHEETRLYLVQHFETALAGIERRTIFRLLNSDQTEANTLAAHLIELFVTADSLSVRNIVRLGDHEVLSVRQVCYRMFEENIPRMCYEREDALRLLESTWEDTRKFAFAYFRQHFGEREWTLDLLLHVCDSVRPDVQTYSRQLIAEYLRVEDGPEFLLRISQHPRPEMQHFAAQYLEQYAAGNPERLEQLTAYCITLLSQVNKSRKARDLVMDFLHKESLKSEKSAAIVSKILNRMVLTTVIEDKARYIEIIRDIGKYSIEIE